MITRVVLAKLSPTMEEGTVVKWTKGEGDAIKVGDVLAEIETDKANMEMEALGAGLLRKILVPAGGKAPVGALIGVIADAGEDIGALLSEAAGALPSPTPATVAPALAAAPTPVTPEPAAPAVEAGALAVTAPGDGTRVKASPLARSMATQRNIPLAAISGSGPGGRVIKRDIEAWSGGGAPAGTATSAPASASRPMAVTSPVPAAPALTPGQEIPLSNMRKTIARRLVESKFSAPHFYVTVEIDMDASAALRAELGAAEVKLSYNDLVVRACALALARFPWVNASWGGDKIVTHADVNVGVAVALPDGLITPVVRNADHKSVGRIAAEIRDLAGRAREKKLKPEEYLGSTFTVSNLGMYDVTEFTAIINPPDAAILAVGAVRQQPVVKDEALAVGRRMKVTLSADHRVVDGALAAQFLAEVRRLLEHPLLLLV